jgi:transposase-like protein
MEWTEAALRWKRLSEEYDLSGVKRKDFCSERGIKPSTFDYWRSRLRKTGDELAGVVEVARVAMSARPITVRVGERLVVELDGQASEEQLARVLRAAGRI